MRTTRACFNILLRQLWVTLLVTLASGLLTAAPRAVAAGEPTEAKTPPPTAADDAKGKKKKKPKPLNRLRVHIEAKRELAERSLPLQVGRSSPMSYVCEKMPILNESHLANATIVDQPGGFILYVRFNSMGTKLLEGYTSGGVGRHLVILTDIDGETRALAAPLIRQRISDGTLKFSPDASHEDMERLVEGLNKAVEKEKKKSWFAQ